MDKSARFNIVYVLMALTALLLIQEFIAGRGLVDTVSYSEFQNLAKTGQVKEITVAGDEIRGELKAPKQNQKQFFKTPRVDVELARDLEKYNVKFSGHLE